MNPIHVNDLKGKLELKNGRLVLKKDKPVFHTKRPKKIIPVSLIDAKFRHYLKDRGIFIPYNVCSSKNSKTFLYMGKPGHKVPKLVPSDAYRRYVKVSAIYWERYKKLFLDMIKYSPRPLVIKFYFIRETKATFDYLNMEQGPADLMKRFGWIPDDNMDEFVPVSLGYEVDPECPGLVIYV